MLALVGAMGCHESIEAPDNADVGTWFDDDEGTEDDADVFACGSDTAVIEDEEVRAPTVDPTEFEVTLGDTHRFDVSCGEPGATVASYALAHWEVDGQREPVLIAALEHFGGGTFEPTYAGVAVMRVKTGELLHCRPDEGITLAVTGRVIASSNPPKYWVTLMPAVIDDTSWLPGEAGPAVVLSGGPDDAQTFREVLPANEGVSHRSQILTRGGQLITFFSERQVFVSLDALTGALNWTRSLSSVLGTDDPRGSASFTGSRETGGVDVTVYAGSGTYSLTLDRCGERVDSVQRSAEVAVMFRSEDIVVTSSQFGSNSPRVTTGWRPDGSMAFRTEGCQDVVVLAAHQVGCFVYGDRGITGIRTFDLRGDPVTIQDFELDVEGFADTSAVVTFRDLVASPDVLLVSATVSHQEGDSYYSVVHIGLWNPRRGELVEVLQLRDRSLNVAPLLTAEGLLVIPDGEHVHVVETNLEGLGAAPSPRLGWGGNENRHLVVEEGG
ncbi:hypothetical protein FRC96_09270 [Lujinxingia vulgaris]|uniref:Uncharacterized protein n=1 Tax=Lujinxingia vulgaris TaxID=2600176 RepID=A0A5C6XB22_9DELT|nr:hypothetical protein [Lujinxingia vulgaris]TXD36896.1 hypothetical protein FRC96_09270 [Lujinxingia vulgaris]